MKVPSIGILFNLDELVHGSCAIELFMNYVDPHRLIFSTLFIGDVLKPSSEVIKSRYDYCVVVSSMALNENYLRDIFENLDDKRLAPKYRRIIIGDNIVGHLGLCEFGNIDDNGRLMTDEWIRIDHDRCRKTGWGYNPLEINYELGPELIAELLELRNPNRDKN